jgi:hypothetical protein
MPGPRAPPQAPPQALQAPPPPISQIEVKIGPREAKLGARRAQERPGRSQNEAKMEPKEALEPLRKTLKNVPPGGHRFGPQNEPQYESKSSPKLAPFLDLILVQFRGRFWGSFECHLGPKTGPGEVWRSLREPSEAPRDQKDNFQKSGFRIGLSTCFRS